MAPTLDTKKGIPPTSILALRGIPRERGHGIERERGGKVLGTVKVAARDRRI